MSRSRINSSHSFTHALGAPAVVRRAVLGVGAALWFGSGPGFIACSELDGPSNAPPGAALAQAPRQPSPPAGPARGFTPALTKLAYTKQDWTLYADVTVYAGQRTATDQRTIPVTSDLVLSSVQFFYPAIPSCASSVADPSTMRGQLFEQNRVLDDTPRLEVGFQGPCAMAVWEGKDIRNKVVRFKGEIDVVSYETTIDEKIARSALWPTREPGPELRLCLEPQLFVEARDPRVAELVAAWLPAGPRGLGPYDTAKKLAAGVIDHVRLTERSFEYGGRGAIVSEERVGIISGYRVSGAAWSAREGIGSEYDLTCLYVAALRASGIPARLVIAFDVRETERKPGYPVLRSWAEFFLPRETVDARKPAPAGATAVQPPPLRLADGEWILVDVARQKTFSSKAPPLAQPWKYFGQHDETDFLCPFAFHWVPPAGAASGGPPAVWGWIPQPANPVADQQVNFRASERVRRGRGQREGR